MYKGTNPHDLDWEDSQGKEVRTFLVWKETAFYSWRERFCFPNVHIRYRFKRWFISSSYM